MTLATTQKLWFQQSGAPAQCVEDFRQWLNATHPGRSFGPGGPIARPLLAPNLTPMVFVETSEGQTVHSPSQYYKRSRGKVSGSSNRGRCQHFNLCSTECREAHCNLPGSGRRPLGNPAVMKRLSWFDHLVACSI
jgi:hypothetical protein